MFERVKAFLFELGIAEGRTVGLVVLLLKRLLLLKLERLSDVSGRFAAFEVG